MVAESRILRPGDVGGEEVDAVAVEVASSAIVVLSGSGVGVAGQDLGIAQRDSCIEGVGIPACRSERGYVWRGMRATFAIRMTMR